MPPFEFVEESIDHDFYKATKLSINDLTRILIQPRDSACVGTISII